MLQYLLQIWLKAVSTVTSMAGVVSIRILLIGTVSDVSYAITHLISGSGLSL